MTRVEPFTGTSYQRSVAVNSAKQLIGKKYDLLTFNCEHYANSVQHNRSYSSQVNSGVLLGFLAVVAIGIRASR